MTNRLLDWLKIFQTVWLPENLPNDSDLFESIKTKLHEFEQLILETNDEEEYHRARLLDDHSASNSDTEQIPIASTSSHETPIEQSTNLLHQSNNENEEEQARQLLLEQSDSSGDEDEVLIRPSICIKRISQADAERYMPSAWKNDQKSSSTSSSSTSEDEQEEEDDYNIIYRTRKSLPNKSEKSSIQSHQQTKNSSKKTNDIFINYNPSKVLDQPSLEDSLTIAEDIGPMDDDRILNEIIENNDNESLFESLNITPDGPVETNSPEEIVDVPDDRIEHISTQDSSDDTPIEVQSYSHLLHHSKLSSSDTDTSKKDRSVKEKNKSKRLIFSPPDSSVTPTKKKSKRTFKQRAALSLSSSSSDENENDLTLTADNDGSRSPQTSSRVRIQRSSSSSDDDDDNSPTKRSRRQRKKSAASNERSNILKEIKRKTFDKKSSKSSSSSPSSDENRSNKKKKSALSDDNESNSTSDDTELSPSKGRKNIRKILDDKELDIQTKNAIAAERERRKRIAENQQKYNETLLEQSSSQLDTSDEPTPSANPRLILELDKTTNEPLIEVSSKLVEQMKTHQCDGVRFLWNNVFESIDAIQNRKHLGNGCILAHCMGLGKTLQVISLIHTVFNYQNLTNVRTCLVLCPINTALNWTNEFDHWLNGVEPPLDHYQFTTIKPALHISHLNYWYENGGVMIMGYDRYRRLVNGNKTNKEDIFKCLVDPGPDIVVADEGHILKNAKTALAKCLAKIKTRRRIVLTGTPLQNNLIEYYCMVTFIKPKLLGSQSEYINRFVNPIQNGQHRDSNEDDVRLMKRRACVLHELLTGFVDRKDYSLLKEYLPPKYEYIIKIRLSDLQSKLYEIYLDKFVQKEQRALGARKHFHSAKLFADFNYLHKIWTHPFLLYPQYIEHWKKQNNKDDESLINDNESEIMFIDEEEDENVQRNYSGFLIDNIKNEHGPKSNTSSEENGSNSKETDDDDDDIELIRTYPTRSRGTVETRSRVTIEKPDEPWLNDMREEFWFPFLDMLPSGSEFDIELSGKFLLLKYLLEKCTEIGDKIILFSRSLLTLNHIEQFLHYLHQQNENEFPPKPIQWLREKDYFRMDGQTDVTARKRYTKIFNNPENLRARLFLISTLAGGMGINLVGSNRVIVFDASWNPSHDTQAIFRSYRFGQKKPVYIYRFLAYGTMEEKIYQRQVVKQSLSQRVIDDHQLDRHYTQNDITELYKFEPEQLPSAETTSTPLNFNHAIPKDHLLLDLLYEHNRWIHSYHSHDSLLENKIDEGLTTEERRRALEEYENLKRLPESRQINLERLQQQQQRLNNYIAQQHLSAQIQQLNPDVYRNINGQPFQFTHIIQQLQAMNRTTVPIQPRPTISNITNDPIVVDSDEEQQPDDTISK